MSSFSLNGQPLTAERLKGILGRIQQLKNEGANAQNSPELVSLSNLVKALSQAHQKQQQLARSNAAPNGLAQSTAVAPPPAPQPNGLHTAPNTSAPPSALPLDSATAPNGALDASTSVLAPPEPSRSPPVVPFTPEQVASLRCQVWAFKLLSRNLPVPLPLQQAIFSPAEAAKLVARIPEGADLQPDTFDANGFTVAEVRAARDKAYADEAPLEGVENPNSLVYPHNAYATPREAFEASMTGPTKRMNVLIPTLLPEGLDPLVLMEERDRFIDARIQFRIRELESFPSDLSQEPVTLGAVAHDDADDFERNDRLAKQKLKALIELKSLTLLSKQKALRENIIRGLNQASSLSLPADRAAFRRSKKQSLRDARVTEHLERKQKIERERRAKQKHLDSLTEIANHGRDMLIAHRGHQAKFGRLGKAVLKFHADADKEEARRVERVSKERLKALRADDEEGYLKLIDTAKDTRITHLLRQTDAFLESLAAAVVDQQNEARVATADGAVMEEVQENTEAVDESRFGAAPVFEDEKKDKVDYYNVAHRIKETITKQPSILIGGELKAYQIKGLEWMVSLYNNHVNGILADEMGLGKTIQTLSLITFLIEVKKQNGPYLVIVPLSTMPNWISEFEKWAPSVRMISYKGTPAQRKNAQNEIRAGNFQVLLTTYEYIIKDRPLLAKIKWLHMIIDEGHRMKNAQSRLSMTLTTYYSSRYRLILTGTPLQNNLPELWALLNFVLPKIFGSVKSFDEWFNAPFANTGGQDKIEINEEESLLVIRRLHKVLRPFLLRRLKKDVESDLPDKVERVIKCKMSSLQLKLTKQIKEHGMIFTDGPTEGNSKATGIRGLQNQIMQLRKICNHPFVFDAVESSINPTQISDATLYRVAGKFEVLDRILPKLFASGHRVLMFFQMTTVMTIFEDYLNFRRIAHLRLDGTTKHEDRSSLLKAFNDPNSQYPIFILSTRAGGLGLNLQTADTVIIFDSDWNPHQDLQAQDRAHRIGQKKEVRILRLVTERSIEEHVMAGASRKIEMDKKVIQAGRYDNKSTAEERDEYLRALLEGGDEEDEDQEDDVDEAEALNEAIARSEEERALFSQMDKDRRRAEEAAWHASGQTGKLPERLIAEWELPAVYRMEHKREIVEDEIVDGQRRARTNVQYDDGMSEEQWDRSMRVEDDDEPPQPKRRGRPPKNKNLLAGGFDSDSTNSGRNRGARGTPDPSTPRGLKRVRPARAVSSSVVTSDDSDSGSDSDSGNAKRRKVHLTPEQEGLKGIADQCLAKMEALDNPTMHHQCTGLFNQLPSKRDYPDYYTIIRDPIVRSRWFSFRASIVCSCCPHRRSQSLKEIKKKINTGGYATLSAFEADVHLMLRNAMTYNDDGSVVYHDARMLKQVFDIKYREMIGGGAAAQY
ncbi:BZ3500_MvSof-1268-A1-R1_Chr1-1g00911 [Microbotryum saponariae]|uniref:BZ3500_MvSof-1268-A1-R1_Chr1-1g00911 protein n=1 Tax=Microbotryum saponariae TaxID=289078 RepID=A0A2X0K8R6_9BASI|nr:BZ3500_MvSof-1268-A1-R1_Chr1-1g00911 [Microbotryum saponariae]SCZ92915.1 BZ3501_MvSof-1269-A2-R1_Chr1-1g00508 [Microbotryum saponariae]